MRFLNMMACVGLSVTVEGSAFCAEVQSLPEKGSSTASNEKVILTPPAPSTPRINGASVFGVRPGSPFLYTIPATGDRPMTFSAEGLPSGLSLDPSTGQITGSLSNLGTNLVMLIACNAKGEAKRPFKIVVGEQIGLTPAMGWNTYTCWGTSFKREHVLRAAKAMKAAKLDEHGWSYINMDDGWQGIRGGASNALQPNELFADMKGLVDQIHALGLKAGIYHSPWVMTYGSRCGGTSEDPKGIWDPKQWPREKIVSNKKILPRAIGRYSFVEVDVRQFAEWGFDYLKYDWNPIEAPDVILVHNALRRSGRDLILSLSNSTPFKNIKDIAPHAESWRTTGDILTVTWKKVIEFAFAQMKWAPYQTPGHLIDPDTIEIGIAGKGKKPKPLTPDEQYTHVSLWCMLSAPLLLGCDLERLDPFTRGLITNDEVLAIDQDELCKIPTAVTNTDEVKILVKELADGNKAVGLFNVSDKPATLTLDWKQAKLTGKQNLRDLWRQKDLGTFSDTYSAEIPSHGCLLLKVSPAGVL